MPGRGPMPKPAGKRARTNSDPMGIKLVTSEPVPQPPLPDFMPDGDPWPEQTRMWWEMWGRDPLAADFRFTDWSELMDCAVVHGQFWAGDIKQASELRLRTAKFGATAEDRARLRIQYAAADEADEKRRTSRPGADARGSYAGLRVAK